MILENAISFVFSFLGLFIVHRILVGCDFRSLTGHSKTEFFSYSAAFMLQIATTTLFNAHLWANVLILVAEILTLLVLRAFLLKKNINDFEMELQNVLEETVLNMKIGAPFRVALESAFNKVKNPPIRTKFLQIRDIVFFNRNTRQPHLTGPLQSVVRDLIQIDRSTLRNVQQLSDMKARIKNGRDFRHKSGTAARHARLQSVILSIIYILLLAIVNADSSKGQSNGPILVSLVLFLTGGIAVFLIGRKRNWKV